MRRPLPPLNALRAFEAAGRHESFSRAAEELNVSHSAVSRHVRGLEHYLSCQLFQDLPRGVALSAQGRAYLARISPALDEISEASEGLREVPAGTVVISCEPLFAAKVLIPKLGDFYERHPDIDLRVVGTPTMADIARYEADFALRFFWSGVPDRAADLIADSPQFPVAAPAIASQIKTPADILRFRMMQDRKGQVWRDWFAREGSVDLDLVPERAFRMRANLSIEAAIAGLGVLLAGEEVLRSHLARGELVRCFDTALRQGRYFLVGAEGVTRRKAARSFRSWLLEASAELRSADQ